jgi:Zn-dependent metalloprotease
MKIKVLLTYLFATINLLVFANQNIQSKAIDYLKSNKEQLHLSSQDINDLIVTKSYKDESTGITHIFFRQTANNIELANSTIGMHLDAQGNVVYQTGDCYYDLKNKVNSSKPIINIENAIKKSALDLGFTINNKIKVLKEINSNKSSFKPNQRLIKRIRNLLFILNPIFA